MDPQEKGSTALANGGVKGFICLWKLGCHTNEW